MNSASARKEHVRGPDPFGVITRYARETLGMALGPGDVEAAYREFSEETPHDAWRVEGLMDGAFRRLGRILAAADIEECSRLGFEATAAAQVVWDDARALLPSLKYRGYRSAVVTNSIFPARMLERQLSGLGLAGYIDAVVTSADVGAVKPRPEPLLRALGALGVAPHEALFVGDTVATDIEAAHAAGLRAVLLDRDGGRDDTPGCVVVRRLSGVNGILGEGAAERA